MSAFDYSSSASSSSSFTEFMNVVEKGSGYDKVMHLCIYVDTRDDDDDVLFTQYKESAQKHNQNIMDDPCYADAGFDLFAPTGTHLSCRSGVTKKVDFSIRCSAGIYYLGKYLRNGTQVVNYTTGYYVYPRSSISKTPLRLANNTGIIDAGYRGHLIGMFDVHEDYVIQPLDRLVQICAPGLVPIFVEIVATMDALGPSTSRGSNGLGSSGR
jgi:dUTPase